MTTTARIRTIWDDRQRVGCLIYADSPFGKLYHRVRDLELAARFLRAGGVEERWHNDPELEALLHLMDGVDDYAMCEHHRKLYELTHEELARAIDEWQDVPRDERRHYLIPDDPT